MLKSTYKPPPNVAAPSPLLPGWTEHKAPTGHTYYYNAETKVSTYTRPSAPNAPPSNPTIENASASFFQYQSVPSLSDPRVANAFLAQYNSQQSNLQSSTVNPSRDTGVTARPRPQPLDKPRSKQAIPGCDPWILVNTKYGRRFVYHPGKNTSYWRIPEKLKPAIMELDQARIRDKVAQSKGEGSNEPTATVPAGVQGGEVDEMEDSSEYEEVEVTDDEQDDQIGDQEHRSKRQRTEEATDQDPVEFSEADIAFQLQAMGGGYGIPGEDYVDDDGYDGQESDDEPLSEDDAIALFADLLDDFKINPYSPWEELIERNQIVDDPRYTVLNTMKARKEVWQEWSKNRIKELKELRAKEEKKDPRISYMSLLHEKATPKLFWPEFKRKYRKEASMTDPYIKDKDREKWYREHISRLKMPQPTLKTDLAALLKSVPPTALNCRTLVTNLPAQILSDIRYISLPSEVRDPLIEAFIKTLGPPPENENSDLPKEEDEATRKAKEAKERRSRALEEREKVVAEQKRRQRRNIEIGRARLREEEREIELAMQVGKRGLQSQLASIGPGKADMDS